MPKNPWNVVVAGVVILMCLGVAYAWGVFLIPIDQDLGWGRAKISFAVSILLLVFSAFMAIGGFCEKKFGPQKTASLGGMLVGLGWIFSASAGSPFELYLFYGGLAGIGTGLSYMPAISSGIKCFPKKKGLISGIIIFGFGFGTAFLSPLMTHSIKEYGWRPTMICGGLIFGTIITIAAQFLKIPSANINTAGDMRADLVSKNFSPKEMLTTRTFRVMFTTYFMAMVAGMMVIGHIIAFISDKNFKPMQAALALTILSIFNGVGRIFFGFLYDILGSRKSLITLFTLISATVFSLYHAPSLSLMYWLAGSIGLCFGGFLAVYPPLTADYFGQRDFSLNYGLIFIGYGSGCFMGPLIAGFVHDITGNYSLAFNFAAGLALWGGWLVFTRLKPPAQKIA